MKPHGGGCSRGRVRFAISRYLYVLPRHCMSAKSALAAPTVYRCLCEDIQELKAVGEMYIPL